jgi:hypothetical protein
MNIFILKLAVAVIPLFILVSSVTLVSAFRERYAHRPLYWSRKRRHILHALAHGTLLR